MSQLQSDLVTTVNCRKILRAWRTGRFASQGLFTYGNSIELARFRVIVERDGITVYRHEKGQKRRVRKKEIPQLEQRFRRVLQEIESFLGPPQQFKPLDVDIGSLLQLLAIILERIPVQIQQKAERTMRLAIEKPGTWLHKHGHRRGLTKPTKNLHALAFLDVITDARAAAELDHRSEPNELASALRKIGRRVGFDVEAPRDDEISKSLRTLRRSLTLAGWVLIVVDINSDSYPFFVIPETAHRRVRALMRKVGIKPAKV